MSGITVVSPDELVGAYVAERYKDRTSVRTVWSDAWPSPHAAVVEVVAAAPEIVLLGPGIGEEDAFDLLSELDRTQPNVGVVAMVPLLDTMRTVRFLRGGAREVIDDDAPRAQVGEVLDTVLDLFEQRRSSISGRGIAQRRVIAFLSPKGGTGKTTMAVNAAVGMAKRARNQVLLVDLDTQFGDAAPTLGIEPEFSLASLSGLAAGDRSSMKVFLSLHASSLALLSPPDDFAEAESLNATELKSSLAALSEEFPYLLIDTAGGIDEFALLAMEFATDLVMVVTPDIASIRAVRRQLDALDQLGLIGHRRHLVINRADTKSGLSSDDIQSSLGLKATVEVPTSRTAALAANQGIPLIDTETRDAALRPINELIDHFLPDPSEAPSRGLRLFRKA